VLVACAVAAAAMALGVAARPGSEPPAAAHAAGAHATAPSVASLKAQIRRLLPATRCDAGRAKRARALKLRKAALRNIGKAPPRVLRRKKASLRRAVALLRQARAACAATPPVGGAGGPAPPGTPAPPAPPGPGPGPAPPTPGTTVITLHVVGNTLRFVEPSATAPAGSIRLELVNGSNFNHFVAVRTAPMQPTIGESPLSSPGQTVSVTVTLAPGTYQVFCRNNDHDVIGPMVMPLTVT
jgi:hypothetical protein